jgi:hypothetical protein
MALLTFPLAFHREMYGALIALPFVAATTADGLFWGLRRHAALAAWLRAAALILTLAGALAVIAHRSLNATPAAVWRAALFIEDLDPQGPFRIVAPEPARAQMQAYVSGCPRFNVSGSPDARVVVRRPPGFGGPLRQQFQAWVNYMRAMVAVAETGTDWYGHKPRVYHVIVSGDGSRPPQGRLLYRREGVEIYAPPGQEVPKGDASAAAPGT